MGHKPFPKMGDVRFGEIGKDPVVVGDTADKRIHQLLQSLFATQLPIQCCLRHRWCGLTGATGDNEQGHQGEPLYTTHQ